MKSTDLPALLTAAALGALAVPAGAHEHTTPAVAQAVPTTVVDLAVGSTAHTTLVTAVTTAGLVETLQGPGPFTVFAPTNDAFAGVPADAMQALFQPAGKADLTKVLTYHVVAGKVLAADLITQIRNGGGQASLTTVEGGALVARLDENGNVVITDEQGGLATVAVADLEAGNGVVHVTDAVFMPD